MEPEKPTNIPVKEPLEPAIDPSTLFQKDETPIPWTAPKKSLASRLSKRGMLLVLFACLLIVGGGGITLANLQKSSSTELADPTPTTTRDSGSTSDIMPDDQAGVGANNDEVKDDDGTSPDTPVSNTPSPATPPAPTPGTSPGTSTPSSPTPPPAPKTHTITYGSQCYSPANVTIARGDIVRFVNESNKSMWPATDKHPQHDIYPEFDSKGGVAPGGSYSFAFSKTGNWGYHDHNKPGCTGTITVR